MKVICKADFPVAIEYNGQKLIFPSYLTDRTAKECPDELYGKYDDLLFCVKPPVKKQVIKIPEPPKPLQGVRISREKIENKQDLNFKFKLDRATRGKKRTWDIWKNKRPTPEKYITSASDITINAEEKKE